MRNFCWNKKKVLVTGGAGFIGANLCRRLLSEGCYVVCLDNFVSGRRENVEELLGNKMFSIVEGDVCDEESFSCIEEVDFIYNLACPASPPYYQSDPIGTLMTCVLGAKHVLELALRTNARVLQASTSEVYGDPLEHPQVESYRGNVNPIGPRACYDEGKRASETLFFDYKRIYGADVRVVRIFNTYGPFMRPDDGRVVSNLIRQALAGTELTVYGNGKQTRSFCYIDDMVDALLAMMANERVSGPVNLGNPGEFTVIDLAEKVIRMTGSTSTISFGDLPADDPSQRNPDISLAEKELGWKPKVDLEDGLEMTIEYFRNIGE